MLKLLRTIDWPATMSGACDPVPPPAPAPASDGALGEYFMATRRMRNIAHYINAEKIFSALDKQARAEQMAGYIYSNFVKEISWKKYNEHWRVQPTIYS